MTQRVLPLIIEELMTAADMAAAERADGRFKYNIQIKGKSAHVRLNHGLGIRLRKDGGAYILTIWRIDQMPAMREWNIVTACFPYDTGVITPIGNTHDRAQYYMGRIPARPEVTGIPQL